MPLKISRNALKNPKHAFRNPKVPFSHKQHPALFKPGGNSAVIMQKNLDLKIFKLRWVGFWLARFKEEYRLAFNSIFGESGSVDEKIVGEWKDELEILDGYDKKNIFNADGDWPILQYDS